MLIFIQMDLTETSKLFKKGVLAFIIFVFGYYLVTSILVPSLKNLADKLDPNKIKPNPIYGLLESLEFVEKPTVLQNVEYQLNTKNGRLPTDLPNVVKVYKFRQALFSYEAGKHAKEAARLLGFGDSDLVSDLKGNIYGWRSLKTGGTLDINIDSKELKLSTPLSTNIASFAPGIINESFAADSTKNLFKAMGRWDDLYNNGDSKAYLGKFVGNSISQSGAPSDAQIARVELFRSIDGRKIFGPDAKKGLLHAFVKAPDGSNPALNFPIVEANYWELDTNSTAEYPIIDVKDAWNAVANGKGVISSVLAKNDNPFSEGQAIRVSNILINNIYLAYYETPKFQKYLQPIYVFEGNYTSTGSPSGDIMIYFPAIQGQFIKSAKIK